MRTPDRVERRVAAPVDHHAAVLGPRREVAVRPDAGEPLEVRAAVRRTVGVAPEADRHRGERAVCTPARPCTPAGAGWPSSSHTSTAIPSTGPWISPAHTGRVGSPADEAAAQVGAARDRREVDVGLHRVVHVRRSPSATAASRSSRSCAASRGDGCRRAAARPLATPSMNLAETPSSVTLVASATSNSAAGAGMERAAVEQHDRRLRRQRRHEPVPHHPTAGREVEDAVARPDVAVQLVLAEVLEQHAAGAVDDALRRRRSCPTSTGWRRAGRTAAARTSSEAVAVGRRTRRTTRRRHRDRGDRARREGCP